MSCARLQSNGQAAELAARLAPQAIRDGLGYLVVGSRHSLWVFDPARRRFQRRPREDKRALGQDSQTIWAWSPFREARVVGDSLWVQPTVGPAVRAQLDR